MILKALLVAFAGYVAVVVLAALFQRSMIYFPMSGVEDPALSLPGERVEQVAFVTEDGVELEGWFVSAHEPVAGSTVLVFNGNAGHRGYRAGMARALAGEGMSVLLFDYRGYGDNDGSPSEAGLRADARAALAHLLGRDDVDPERIVYLGESLGSAVALGLATENAPAALVLRSPFTSLADVGRHHYPFLPVRLLIRDRYRCVDLVERLRSPLLVIAGDEDRIVPPAFSRRLFDAAPEPKEWVVLEGVGHNDLEMLDGAEFIAAIERFVRNTG